MGRILITGSSGLIGGALARQLRRTGHEVVGFDVAAPRGAGFGDVTDQGMCMAAMAGCTGVVHLAAVSRVIWGERDPARCREVNVGGTDNILAAAHQNPGRPWVLLASSREVYGQATVFPVSEDAPLQPMNAYARSKAAAEELAAAGRRGGDRISVIRFCGVYGTTGDHADRVAPGFARQAATGGVLRVDGADTTLDFTHLDDVTEALERVIGMLEAGEVGLPTLHLVSGRGIRLADLAALAVEVAGRGEVVIAPPRTYDISRFTGDPARAQRVLGWRAHTPLADGIARLVAQFQAALAPGAPTPRRPA